MPKFKNYMTKSGQKKYKAKIVLGVDPATGKRVETVRMVSTKKEGAVLERQLKTDFERGILKRKEKTYTYYETYILWLEEYEQTVKDSTLMKTKRDFKNHILPAFGSMLIDKITPMDIQNKVNQWAKKLTKASTIANYAGLIFKYAQRMGLIESNPVSLVRKPPKPKKSKNHPLNFYDTQTLKIFFQALEKTGSKRSKAFFRLLAFTGMRKAEASALRWIDVTSKTVNIDKAVVRNSVGIYIGTPKTSTSTRRISLDRETYNVLLIWKELQNPKDESWLIFSDDGHKIQSLDTSRKWLLAIQDEMDVISKRRLNRITVHGFRHTHASLLFESGASIKNVQDRLGHSDVKTTMDIYTHVSKKAKEDVAENFATFISDIR